MWSCIQTCDFTVWAVKVDIHDCSCNDDFLVVVIIQFKDYVICSRGAQILNAWSPQVDHIQDHLISVGLQYGTCIMSCFWHPEFWGGVFVFEKSVLACFIVYLFGWHPLPSLKYKFKNSENCSLSENSSVAWHAAPKTYLLCRTSWTSCPVGCTYWSSLYVFW